MTAHSFVNAWNYTANSANKQASASFFSTIEGYDDLQKPDVDPKATLSGLTVVDDNTIDVKLSQPDSAFPVKAGSGPPHVYCNASGLTSGKVMVSRIVAPVRAMSSRSMPMPMPPAGGMPTPRASKKSSSMSQASSSPASASLA